MLTNHRIKNKGGKPRYNVITNSLWITKLLEPGSILIYNYIKESNEKNKHEIIKQDSFNELKRTINYLIYQFNTKYKNTYS